MKEPRKTRLTKTLIESLQPNPGGREVVVYDTAQTGLQVRVRASGVPIYYVYYRIGSQQRKHKIGRHGKITLDDARTEAARVLGEVAAGKDPSGERKDLRRRSMTLSAFWDLFLADRSNRWKRGTRTTNESIWKRHVSPRLGEFRLHEITPHEVATFHKSMSSTPVNANRALQLLRSMINQARDWELFSGENPASRIRPYPERARETFLSPAQLVTLLNAIAEEEAIGGLAAVERDKDGETSSRGITPWQAALFRLLIATGARLREIMDARWEYVDWKAGALRLPDSKTGKKTIWLNSLALEQLERLRLISRNPVWIIEGRIRGSHLVNAQKPWDRVRQRASKDDTGKVVDKTLQNLRLHDLRHSFASFGIEAGLDLFRVGKALGHSQARTTARYAHIIDASVKEAAEKVGTHIRGHIEGKPAEKKKDDSPLG